MSRTLTQKDLTYIRIAIIALDKMGTSSVNGLRLDYLANTLNKAMPHLEVYMADEDEKELKVPNGK